MRDVSHDLKRKKFNANNNALQFVSWNFPYNVRLRISVKRDQKKYFVWGDDNNCSNTCTMLICSHLVLP